MKKKTVAIGFLGTTLDKGYKKSRWKRWRPTVAMCQQPDLSIDRIELFHDQREDRLAEHIRSDVAEVSAHTQVQSVLCELRNPWDFEEVYAALYDWARQYPFDTQREEYVVHISTGTHVAQICWFLLVESRHVPARLLQTSPGRRRRDTDEEGVARGTYEMIDLDLSRYDALAQRFETERADAVAMLKSGIATRNARFNQLIKELEYVAVRSTAPMLLTGPTGAGKSMLARRVYELKKARHLITGNFVDVNCATLRGDGAASALFGHSKGAYTGATANRAGWLRTAHKGMLFLDEIGELGLDEQAMLLKAIEEKRFIPVGADVEVASDFQFIAGTNRDLREEVQAGRFREDLFARINLWSYQLPALAQRREDIDPNIDHQLQIASKELGRSVRMHTEARQAYLDFALSPQATWRGNFRDLASSIIRLATLADGRRISKTLVEAEIERLRWQWQETATPAGSGQLAGTLVAKLLGAEAAEQLDLFDRMQLEAVLTVCQRCSNMSEAGRELFNQSRMQRSTNNDSDRLRKYLKKFGLDWKAVRP